MIDQVEKKMCACKKPLKELKMLIAFGTGFGFEMQFFLCCCPLWCEYLFSVSVSVSRELKIEFLRDGNVHFWNIFCLVIRLSIAGKIIIKNTQTSKFHSGNPLKFNLIFWYDYVRSLPHEKISQKCFLLWLNYVSGKVCLSHASPPEKKAIILSISVIYWIITSVSVVFF